MGSTGRDLHIDNHLSQIALAYSQSEKFIATQIAPIVQVSKRSDLYPIWSQADWFRVEDDTRADNTKANKIVQSVSSDSYYCRKKSLGKDTSLEDLANVDIALARIHDTNFVVEKLMLAAESRIASQVRSTSNVGSSSTVTSAWTDYDAGDSDPLNDMWTAQTNVEDATGYIPNKTIMGRQGWRNFHRHADVIDIIHGNDGNPSNSRLVSKQQAAAIFELDTLVIGSAHENTNNQGQANALSSIWADDVLMYYAPAMPSKNVPSFMYQFRWVFAGMPGQMRVQVHPMDKETDSQAMDATYYTDEKITSAPLGFLIQAVNSSQ
jgi:hypothetical protein